MPTVQGSPTQPEAFRLSVVLVSFFLAFGTGLSTRVTGMPLVLAPAVGLTIFFSQGTNSHLLTVPQLYLSGFFAGLILFLCNLGRNNSIRYLILEKMPPQIKSGVAGGIGAILAEKAAEIIRNGSGDFGPFVVVLSAIACLVIFACDTYADRWEANRRPDDDVDLRYYLAKMAYILVPATMFLILSVSTNSSPAHLSALRHPQGIMQLFQERFSALCHPDVKGRSGLCIIVFGGITAFVILTDIVGTPYQMLDPTRLSPEVAGLRNSDLGRRAVSSSFFVDAIMIVLNSLFSIPPSVYYAENHVLYNFRFSTFAFYKRPGWIYSISMLVVSALLFEFDFPLEHFSEISKMAVSPVLLVIGMQVVAFSIRADASSYTKTLSTPERRPVVNDLDDTLTGHDQLQDGEPAHPLGYLPTAMIIILSPVIGLEWSLPLGIAIFTFWNKAHGYKMNTVTQTLGVIAGTVVVLMAWVTFAPN